MKSALEGIYKITMVLPAWTVENELTLQPEEDGILHGELNTMDGNDPIPFTHGKWNKNYFLIQLSVGPGQLQLTGQIEGDDLNGVVVIEDTPDCLCGKRMDLKEK